MRKHIIAIYVVAAFVIGCVTSQAVAPLVVPLVRAGSSPQKWEYFCKDTGEKSLEEEKITKFLLESGQQGWEMVNFAKHDHAFPIVICFKRPL